MLRQDTVVRINEAIHECLDRCYGSGAPLSTLMEFLGELRSRPGWRDAEIDQVEMSVRRLLRALLYRSPEPSGAAVQERGAGSSR
jgi:hypothetical protein